MQSINAGFQSLKTLIPHTDGEKLSKAAILQQTAEYIFSLEQEKTRLLHEVSAQQVRLQQQQDQVRLLHQEKLEREQQIRTQLLPSHAPPAPTHHPTVIVPAPPPSHHVTVVTVGPSSVINT
ncbi:transcription factor AP-4, partial [Antrostomus carolinensis]|uniref:transcription factor AP-4 n=1 Tax=Antrostomus carolinensis TaxID=279965 RepID=UPI0010A988AD